MKNKNDSMPSDHDIQINKAWAQLENKLSETSASPLWEEWEKDGLTTLEHVNNLLVTSETSHTTGPRDQVKMESLADESVVGDKDYINKDIAQRKKRARWASWMRRHVIKVSITAATVLTVIIISTPFTNKALAALLNKFHMDSVVVVQEEDMESIYSALNYRDGNQHLSNDFGTFNRVQDGEYAEISLEQAEQQFGIQVPHVNLGEITESRINTVPGQTLTFTPKVENINDTLKRLGADQLLPLSVDGKPITLRVAQSLGISYQTGGKSDNGVGKYVSVNYSPIPVLEFDPTIDAQDAFDSVIRLPIIPEGVRTALLQSSKMEQGQLPFPVVVNKTTKQITIDGVDVFITMTKDSSYGSLVWKQNNMMVTGYFQDFDNLDEIQSTLTELINK